MKVAKHFLVLSLIGCGLIGCGRPESSASQGDPVDTASSKVALSSPPPLEDRQDGTFFRHDFGTVLPGQVYRHRFVLTNTTASAWTFAKLIPSCSCTVGTTSAQSIAPGKSEWVEVEYKSPPSNQDDRRKVGVQFAEPGSPMFWLEVQARIRQPITFFPEGLTLSQVGKETAESFFEVHNYTGKPIHLEPPRCSEPWLEAELRTIEATSPEVKQAWRVVVRAKTRGLKPGSHRAEVLVAQSGTDFRKTVPIEIDLIAPIRPVPGRLFFGSLTRGQPVEKKLSLLLSSDLTHFTPDDVRIKHDLGDRLVVRCTRLSESRLEIAATLDPGQGGESEINGSIDLTFRDPSLPPISIPVIAVVNP